MNKSSTNFICMLFASAVLPLAAIGTPVQAQDIEPALETSRQTASSTRQAQQRIDEIDSRIQELLADYRANLRQLEQLNRYNASQERQVAAQRQEIQSLTEDINNIASLQRAVQPLMQDMVDALDRVVSADMPFLMDERRSRVDRLVNLMEDPSSSPAQRYRMIIEAYQIEAEYGRTIEGYRADIETEERTYENVDVLRIGRFALIFKTDDDEVLKRYDGESGRWVDLDPSFLDPVKTALRVAREQIPPELLYVPVPAPETANEG
jgi:septal ring factor EnvC (AmiA/AmiB activator)